MADFGKKIQADNRHLQDLTSARNAAIDGGKTNFVARPRAGRVLKVVISTKGLAFSINDGSKPLFVAATTTPENTYEIGTYCENNINVAGISGSGFALLVFDE